MTDQRAQAGKMAQRFREQAVACASLGSPLYAELMRHAAADIEVRGVVARVLVGHEADPGQSLLALRLFGAVHRIVLSGGAPELAKYYPSAGGSADPEAAWPVLRAVLADRAGEVRALLHVAPQTNEVGRSAPLLGGLLHVAAAFGLPIRLYEIGASAGLNLRADLFRYTFGDGRSWGPADSPVVLADAWTGAYPPVQAPLSVVARQGCDLYPVDPTTPEGRLTLASFVWPDQAARFARLRAAVEVAAQRPAHVVQATASGFVAGLALEQGSCLVLWHSVMWQYLDPPERAAVRARLDELGRAASPGSPVAHVAFEPRRGPEGVDDWVVTLTCWPGGTAVVLGEARPHGLPVHWYPPA